MSWKKGLVLALVLLAPARAASAHPVVEGVGTFAGGLLHPLLVPAHAIAVVALGLLAGQQPPGPPWQMPLAYAAGLGIGFGAMISAFVPMLAGEALLTAALLSGAFVALARPLPAAIGCPLALATGIALALDSPPGGISVRDANVTVLGTFCGAVILLLAATTLAGMVRRDWLRIGIRIVGSWIAASALLVLALRLAR